MWKEFKEFAMKGNVVDLAIGVMIGTAFNKIVTSLVNDMITPFFGVFLGGIDFSDLKIPGTEIKYGSFIQSIIDFLIIGFSLFIIIRVINRLRELRVKKTEQLDEKGAKERSPSKEEMLLTEIRDLLKEQNDVKKR
ncbi:large conductance mechanosensitive channel protein MscL [Bacillus kwashiorkori]|uniref:large conductance mechanosensitive channel protein MscL n=1 Tax=Bacillus kwashiorkori TaxID=1522318 RepID=UPI0007822D39|nr:large conductance mechanosensitive channel protein MscL [Bacillus kwashiorkori]